jgi:hypothetical protein
MAVITKNRISFEWQIWFILSLTAEILSLAYDYAFL